MRFLADENFRTDVINFLKSLGHDIKKVPPRSSDTIVAALAKRENRILLTNDIDFSITLNFPPYKYNGILVFRIHPPRFEKFVHAIKHFLALRNPHNIQGKTFIIEENSFIELI